MKGIRREWEKERWQTVVNRGPDHHHVSFLFCFPPKTCETCRSPPGEQTVVGGGMLYAVRRLFEALWGEKRDRVMVIPHLQNKHSSRCLCSEGRLSKGHESSNTRPRAPSRGRSLPFPALFSADRSLASRFRSSVESLSAS